MLAVPRLLLPGLLAVAAVLAPVGAAPAADAGPQAAAVDASVWTPVAALPRTAHRQTVHPDRYRAYTLDRGALETTLADAPDAIVRDEGPVETPVPQGQTSRTIAAGARVSVPAPTGELVEFEVVESPVMEPELARRHPEISTWAGTSVDGTASIRLDLTPAGFHASVRGAGAAWYVDPAYLGDQSRYLSYFGADLPASERLVEPDVLDPDHDARHDARRDGTPRPAAGTPQLGEGANQAVVLRTYRLALLSDPSYASYVAPGASTDEQSDAQVLAAKVTLINRLDQVFRDDLGIHLVLAKGSDRLNLRTYADASGANGPCGASPCFTSAQLSPTGPGCTDGLLGRTRLVIGQLIGAHSYDVGHLALGMNGGGLAYLGVVGTEYKAQGCTGLATPVGDGYAVDYLAHELGHQFGATHTFDGTDGSCADNREALTSVEPGSGSTVMAYAGICAADDLQPHSDPYFGQISQEDVEFYVTGPQPLAQEVQSVSLSGFDGTDSFRLSFGGTPTAAIVRGTNYSAAGIKSAVQAVTGGIVTVTPFFRTGTFDERGFTITFGSFTINYPEPTVIAVSGSFAAAANDIDAGGFQPVGGATTTLANHNPSVTAPADKTIPVRTPFALTGVATDVDGDPLVHIWEQNDAGGSAGTALTSVSKADGPLFRVFGTAAAVTAAGSLEYHSPGENAAGASPTRVFPDLAQVLAGNTNAATGTCPSGAGSVDCLSEWLPTAAYTAGVLHFRLTARDLDPGGGGTEIDEVALTLDRTAGPFRVTSQATSVTLPGGSDQTVTWDVNGTNTTALAPNVRISLSTDGGQTFDTLVPTTPNDGSHSVTLPNVDTGQARIKVEAVGNYFFDVNDAAFSIDSTPGSGLAVTWSVPSTLTVQHSDPPPSASFQATSYAADSAALVAEDGGALPAGLTLVKTPTSAPDTLPGSATWTIQGKADAPPGTYPVHVTVGDGAETQGFDVSVVVTAEDAAVAYTGPTTVAAPHGGDDAVVVPATATVTQAPDGSLGHFGTATVRFTDTTTGETLCAAAPVVASGTGAGTASCSFAADLPLNAGRTYKIGLTLSGPWAGQSAGDATVTVTVPSADPPPAPPDTAITSGPSGWLLGTTATFGYTSSAAGSAFGCALDGAARACGGSAVTLSGLSQRTHRFTVAASTAEGVDPTPATRVFTVPLDDRAMRKGSGPWRRKTASAAYLGTFTEVRRRKGATLTVTVTGARSLALVVVTGKRYGAVTVYLGRTKLRRISLAEPAGYRKLVPVATFGSPRSGKVRIVTTSAKRVRIDGLGVVT